MKARNWSGIAAISDPFLRLALATCSNEDLHARLAAAFPDCFAETEADQGVVLLSEVLRRAGQSFAPTGEDFAQSQEYPVSNGGAQDLPVQRFIIEERERTDPERDRKEPRLPKELERLKKSKFGDQFTWKGEEFVVLENGDSLDFVLFVPAACVINDMQVVAPVS